MLWTTSRKNAVTFLRTLTPTWNSRGTSHPAATQRRSRVFHPNRLRCHSRVEPRKNPIILRYVLPDFSLDRPGQLLMPDQVVKDASWQILEMNNERFTVPELLFTPSDIGMFFASRQMNERDADRGPNRPGSGWFGSGGFTLYFAPS